MACTRQALHPVVGIAPGVGLETGRADGRDDPVRERSLGDVAVEAPGRRILALVGIAQRLGEDGVQVVPRTVLHRHGDPRSPAMEVVGEGRMEDRAAGAADILAGLAAELVVGVAGGIARLRPVEHAGTAEDPSAEVAGDTEFLLEASR